VKVLPEAAINLGCVALAVVFAATGRVSGIAAAEILVMNCRSSPCPNNQMRFTMLSSYLGVNPLPQLPLQHIGRLAIGCKREVTIVYVYTSLCCILRCNDFNVGESARDEHRHVYQRYQRELRHMNTELYHRTTSAGMPPPASPPLFQTSFGNEKAVL
jgi:hypothetical protein